MSPDAVRIGLVEDDAVMGASLLQRLELEGFNVAWWQSGGAALEGLASVSPDLVICDIRLPDISGEEIYASLADSANNPPFLFMTAFADIDQAVRLMRAGAGDYVAKPFRMDDFLDRIEQLVRTRPLSDQAALLGPSPQMRSIADLLARLADTRTPVLLTGETGVGKEVCARFLHAADGGASPFIAVNCSAIPADLMESELFGHEKGAFTGAAQRHLGYAERAGDGTLFLDEIGELPPALQPKLLRLIEERSFTRVGGERSVTFRGRVVSATNQDLESAVAKGGFRADLLYRINTVTIDIPPLRERPADIGWLMQRFFTAATENRPEGPKGITPHGESALQGHDWPGNARELRNRIERAVALSADGAWIGPGDLFPDRFVNETSPSGFPSLGEVREAAEKQQIERALERSNGQVAIAAKLLRISRTTLWQKMRRYGLQGTDTPPRSES